ncbi:MAG TPA: TraR/DksA C4-type zinc finger protein [Acidimicrobiales bacterium]|nr:TraR/DksA C4-type zinc finger protein [Acidimicrobiales bacterium]
MLTFQETSRAASQLSVETQQRFRDLLVLESQARSAQYAEHEAAARQLRDLTDADSVLERELAEAGAQRAREALAEIADALDRMDRGTFGQCTACGRPVPVERLDAIPSARFCVDCPGRRTGWR